MKTTAVLLAAVTLSWVGVTGGVGASVAAAETPTPPATTPTATAPAGTPGTSVATGPLVDPTAEPARRTDERTGVAPAAESRRARARASGGVAAAPASAAEPTPPTQSTSRASTAVPKRPARVRARVSRFTLSARTWTTGTAAPKINLRIRASKVTAARVQVRIENTRRRVVARQSLGVIRSGVNVTKTLTKRIATQPGAYRLQLVMRDATGRKVQAGARALRVAAPKAPAIPTSTPIAAPAPSAHGYVFPVQGPCNFRSLAGQRFRAGRDGGRQHNGHDIGTFSDYPPVVAVIAGTVERVWNDANGGGWTIVYNGDDRIAYGYLHLKPGTITVAAGDRVAAGQVLANAGKSGGNYDPHLHFEMRPIPWDANRATAVDPLPFLLQLPNQCTG